MAGRLFTSARTLKRRLQQCGTSFQALRDEALRLLQHPNLKIQRIALVLGYGGPPSFTRAFLRWTVELPGAVRDKLGR